MFFSIFSKRRKPGVIYWLNTDKIKIEAERLAAQINQDKYDFELKYYLDTGMFWSTIYLKKDDTLVDGYYSYLIAKQFNLGKIPVVYDEV